MKTLSNFSIYRNTITKIHQLMMIHRKTSIKQTSHLTNLYATRPGYTPNRHARRKIKPPCIRSRTRPQICF